MLRAEREISRVMREKVMGALLPLRVGREGLSKSLRAKEKEPVMRRVGAAAVQFCKRQHSFVNEKADPRATPSGSEY